MQKKSFFLLIFFLTGLVYSSCSFSQTEEETLTITTYYPAPFGVYNEMRAKRMAVGTNYYNGSAYPWDTGGGCTGNEICNADLVVQGNVGIGTTGPGEKLDIAQGTGVNIQLGGFSNLGSENSRAGLVLGNNIRVRTDSVTDQVVDNTHASFGYRAIRMDMDNGILFHATGGSVTAGDVIANERMRITNAGNVGIGTAGPQDTLDVYGGGDNILSVVDSASKLGVWIGHNGTRGIIRTTYWPGGSNIFTPLTFQTNNVDRLYIATNGNIGIGTAAPKVKLEILGPDAAQPASSGSTPAGTVRFTDDDRASVLEFGGTSQAPYTNWIQSHNANDQAFNYPLLLQPNGGNVGIGTTDPFRMFQVRTGVGQRIGFTSGISVGGAVVLEAVNDANSANIPLEIRSSNVYLYGALIHPSDVTQKQNIKSIDNAIEKVSRINGVTFQWRDKNRGQAEQMGVIAQDVEKAAPQLIKEYADGTKGVNYDGLNALTIEAIKEQQKEIAALRLEIGALKAELRGLGKRGSE